MQAFVCELLKTGSGKLLVGIAAAAVFSGIYWHFVPEGYVTKLVYGLLLLAGAYKLYQLKTPTC